MSKANIIFHLPRHIISNFLNYYFSNFLQTNYKYSIEEGSRFHQNLSKPSLGKLNQNTYFLLYLAPALVESFEVRPKPSLFHGSITHQQQFQILQVSVPRVIWTTIQAAYQTGFVSVP